MHETRDKKRRWAYPQT